MTQRLLPLLRTALYALRGGFLVRPLLISIALGLAGALLSALEEMPRMSLKNLHEAVATTLKVKVLRIT